MQSDFRDSGSTYARGMKRLHCCAMNGSSVRSGLFTGQRQNGSAIILKRGWLTNSTRSFISMKPAPSNRWNAPPSGTPASFRKPIHFASDFMNTQINIPAGTATLEGELSIPDGATVLVLFVHGSGSSRHSPRNQFVARKLNDAGLATLLFDLLTRDEEAVDVATAQYRFDISLLAERLVHATKWAINQPATRDSRIGYFGSSTGGGGAPCPAGANPPGRRAVVFPGGAPRPGPRGLV